MKIYLTLEAGAGILDSVAVDTGDDDSAEVSERIKDAMADWTLAPGDIIRIIERKE